MQHPANANQTHQLSYWLHLPPAKKSQNPQGCTEVTGITSNVGIRGLSILRLRSFGDDPASRLADNSPNAAANNGEAEETTDARVDESTSAELAE